jgi:pimeloyl-ACP methyl ester carboxylesterase
MLAHRVDGAGEPLVLLNGGMMTMMAWEATASRLAASYRVIRCDFRGQLMSLGAGAPPATLRDHAADVVALLDHLGIARVHVVGASFGALIGIVMTAKHPARVHTLVAANATDAIDTDDHLEGRPLRDAVRRAASGGDGREVLDLMVPHTFSDEWLAANAAVMEARRAQFALMPAAWYAGLDAILGSLEHADLRPLLPAVARPTLVVAAERDRMFPVDRSRALAAGIAGARLVIVPRAAHALVSEDPAAFVDAILPFLSSHPLRGQS